MLRTVKSWLWRARTTKMSSEVVLMFPRWSFAWIVNFAGTPAVAMERPSPTAVETVPEVSEGNTVAMKGEPSTAVAEAKSRSVGTTCVPWVADSQKRWISAVSVTSLYCTLMSYSALAATKRVPEGSVEEREFHWSMIHWSSTHSFTRSSAPATLVVNVYVSVYCGFTYPVNATEKPSSTPRASTAGVVDPQLKSTFEAASYTALENSASR
mmetsp:Transcript_47448/g.112949  ORF Transcript_47448/g.112949 Transcript_47448/m.112949 type:complete len:211 (+) Transcript_47448:15634-16266(+)